MSDIDEAPSNRDSTTKQGTLIKEEPYDPEYDRAHQYTEIAQHVQTAPLDNSTVSKVLLSNPSNTESVRGTELEQSAPSSTAGSGNNESLILPMVKTEPADPEKYGDMLIKEEPYDPDYDNDELHHHTTTSVGTGQHFETASLQKGVVPQSMLSNTKDAESSIETEQCFASPLARTTLDRIPIHNYPLGKDVSVDDRVNRTFDRSKSNVWPVLPMVNTEPIDSPFHDEGHSTASNIEDADPLRVWTVTSSHLVPLDEAENHLVQASSVYGNVEASQREQCEQEDNQSFTGLRSGTSYDSHVAEQVKRGQEECAIHIPKRQKHQNLTAPETLTLLVKQERQDSTSATVSGNLEDLTCKFCLSSFAHKILLETHPCKSAIYFCKICCLESTRPRHFSLMPLPEAQRHFYLHFHPGYFGKKHLSRTDCLTFKYQLPEELQGRTALLNYEEDQDILKDFYIGIFQRKTETQPYGCGLCGATFNAAGARVWHVAKAHLEHKSRKCGETECEKLLFSTYQHDKLLRHMFAAHCDFVKGTFVYLKCKFCTMQFRDRTDLEWHFYWHLKPAIRIAADQEYSKNQPPKGSVNDECKVQFKCALCSYESVDSVKVQVYTSSEACDHLAWHWQSQPPPEIRKNPTVLSFDKDSDAIHQLYMVPFAADLNTTCKFCGRNVTGFIAPDKFSPYSHLKATCRHLESWHKDLVRKPHRCMRPECKHLQFIRKQDFFGHMFLQHVTVVKKDGFRFLCQICKKTFENRSDVEWHCYYHRAKGGVFPVEDEGKAQFRCTICSYETVVSQRVPLYTASEAQDHLAWHWSSQPPPEIRKNPTVLSFEKDSGKIRHLYMTYYASDLSMMCKICGMSITVEKFSAYNHLMLNHKELTIKPYRCKVPECKHLEFRKKQDFFGHMFLQHITVVKKDLHSFSFLCQICRKTFENRSQVEWHCYYHRIKGGK